MYLTLAREDWRGCVSECTWLWPEKIGVDALVNIIFMSECIWPWAENRKRPQESFVSTLCEHKTAFSLLIKRSAGGANSKLVGLRRPSADHSHLWFGS